MEPEQTGPRVNDRIRVTRVLVIDDEGRKLGEFMTEDAIELARSRGLDLIEVAPTARPPVCRIGDFGRMKFEKQKKDKEAKKRQATVELKEVKLRPKTDDHDFEVKVKHTRRFIDEGNKVKITVRFRGREMAHRDIGERRCLEVAAAVEDCSVIEARPNMEGRQMFMILAPKKK
jgi:translation initiation factor IF-3